MANNEGWITVQEAAKLTGYSEQYLRRLIRNKKITAKKLSFLWLVEVAPLLEYVVDAKQSSDKRFGPKVDY
jgi:excisionase family DNA binding protein